MSAMAGADSAGDGPPKMFTGDNEDGKEYKRWKTWVKNKLLTLEAKVPAKAHGAYIYTLLGGRALECVEHLEPEDYQVEGGAAKLFALLDERFPQKEASDEMSEVLTAIFNIKAAEGETLKVWISRATEMFDRCKRKCSVTFPEEAKGWIILHRSGLNEEQKAVVMARSGGAMTREAIGKALRSCYPEFVVSRKKLMGASAVEIDEPYDQLDDIDTGLDPEVEAFLAEHEALDAHDEPAEDEIYDEHEVAEALAVSWRDKRKELSRLQKNRKFHAAADLRRSYRVEVAELKSKSRCRRCLQIGHWERECKQPKGKGKGSQSKSSDSGAASVEASRKQDDAGAAVVDAFEEHFVAAVSVVTPESCVPWERLRHHFIAAVDLVKPDLCSPLEWLRQRRQQADKTPTSKPTNNEILLVSSPGYGVIDSGCGRTIIGRETLMDFQAMWKTRGFPMPEPEHEVNHFRFGNGQRETSDTVMRLPVIIAGKTGTIKAAVVKGRAPLLISRGALQSLHAVIDFGANQLKLFESQVTVPLNTNEAGQYVINVMSQKDSVDQSPFSEVMMSQPVDQPRVQNTVTSEPNSDATAPSSEEPESTPCSNPEGLNPDLQVWKRHDFNLR